MALQRPDGNGGAQPDVMQATALEQQPRLHRRAASQTKLKSQAGPHLHLGVYSGARQRLKNSPVGQQQALPRRQRETGTREGTPQRETSVV